MRMRLISLNYLIWFWFSYFNLPGTKRPKNIINLSYEHPRPAAKVIPSNMPYSGKMSDFPQLPIGASNQAAVDSSILKTESNATEFTVSSAIFSSSTSYAGMAYHPPSLPHAPARSSIKNTTASARSAALRTTHSVQPATAHSSLRQDAQTAEFAHPVWASCRKDECAVAGCTEYQNVCVLNNSKNVS